MANIPGDTGHPWRLNKFVEYQHFAPAIDPLTYCEYARRQELGFNDCVRLAWYHSLTYCEITAALLLELHTLVKLNPAQLWSRYKPYLIFGSARKYAKNMDWFVPLMEQWFEIADESPFSWLVNMARKGSPEEKYSNIENGLSKWKFMGRFSVDLFTEAIIAMNRAGLIPLRIENDGYDWKKTSNLTSGLLNIFYRDEEADIFDKEGKLPRQSDILHTLDYMLETVLREVENKYPKQKVDKVSVVNKICSFRNLFKSARYGGFHHDRQLGNLREYQKHFPSETLWNEFFKIRKSIFPRHMLGEYGGWGGIRPERKKLWVQKGLTGVEKESSC